MLSDDYATRMTNGMVSTLLKLIFQIEIGKNEENAFLDQEIKSKFQERKEQIEQGFINEAENKLLEELDPDNMEYFKLTLMFYYTLIEQDPDFLSEHDFSKGEILDGLRYVSKVYGYESMANALFGENEE
ncbi:DUF6483 family protein [Clostridium sp. E02]|uniref:DUF6483 family protein n=1 Tax=Clostridium sp. E02 TaxID=2487134 RepID=UPI000F52E255|nr:DUF6483 family protein [Clostridium sp. E02]